MSDNQAVPSSVVDALEDLRSAIQETQKSDTHKLLATIRVKIACRDVGISLKGSEVSKKTGASSAYISQVWRATDVCIKRGKDPISLGSDLGHNAFLRRFLAVKKPRKKSPGDPLKIFQTLKDSIRVALEHHEMTKDQRDKLHEDLIWLAQEVAEERPPTKTEEREHVRH